MSDCHPSVTAVPSTQASLTTGTPVIALAGQPNMGKSTLFNLLTGLNQHVGNWPGKTVERRQGTFDFNGQPALLVDLPGTYSLTANSPEEVIAREFILREKPAVVVAVVSAANLERSMYLVAELAALEAPLVVALNMMDVAEQEGIVVDAHVLEAALGLPVVPIIASRAVGVKDLLRVVEKVMMGEGTYSPCLPEIRPDHQEVLEKIRAQINGYVPDPYPLRWIALKLLEGDVEVARFMQSALPPAEWDEVHQILMAHDDAFLAVASGRYEWIGRIVRAAVRQPRVGQIGLTGRLDRWAAHPVWGLIILAAVLGLVFWLTFTIGSPLQQWLDENAVAPLAGWAGDHLAWAPFWLRGMVVDGIIGGVGSVLTFLPILVIFFAAFALLEDVGYMARAAFIMDKIMHRFGLHGRSFIPMIMGFGCNVPAIMATRTLRNKGDRILTMLIVPFMSCSARLPVYTLFAVAFFPETSNLVVFSLYLIGITAGVLALVATLYPSWRASRVRPAEALRYE